jgi:hypothetical protein
MIEQTKPIPLKVTTFLSDNQEEIESEQVIDHSQHKDRLWLGKHCHWAFRNNRGVEIYPLNI